MALSRRAGSRTESNIWAGFVDVMTGLLLVMIFVLSIFMISQFFLRETILGQGRQLTNLEGQLASLAQALGATERERDDLSAQNANLLGQIDDLSTQNDDLLATNLGLNNQLQTLQFEIAEQQSRVANFEEQVASLIAKNLALDEDYQIALAQNTELTGQNQALQQQVDDADQNAGALAARSETLSQENAALSEENAALRLAINDQRSEIEIQAAERAAVEALLADLTKNETDDAIINSQIGDVQTLAQLALQDQANYDSELGIALTEELEALTQAERDRAAQQIAADYLRERLRNSDAELTAMTLALEKERQSAEETLILLAAIDQQRGEIEASELTQAEKDAALLKLAQDEIAARDIANERDARRLAVLNQQTAQLRAQLNGLQTLLDAAAEADSENQVQIDALGTSLNAALARVAAEERKRANDLEAFRSDFFGRLRQVLEGVSGVEIVGDRFVFSSEVLFPTGSASLSPEGRAQIAKVSQLVNQIGAGIPTDIDWILRVDGHTDIQPISSASAYRDNWELSQARALNVVRDMIDNSGVDPRRLAAAGFGEYHPIDYGQSPEALARNRRIELKLTEQ